MHQLEDVNLEYKAFDATANPYIGVWGETWWILFFVTFRVYYIRNLTFSVRLGWYHCGWHGWNRATLSPSPPSSGYRLLAFSCWFLMHDWVISLLSHPQVLPSSTDPLFISTTSPLLPRDPSESILRLQTDPWKKPIREALGEDAISLITGMCIFVGVRSKR